LGGVEQGALRWKLGYGIERERYSVALIEGWEGGVDALGRTGARWWRVDSSRDSFGG
jgi:hypothetical protein